MTEVSGGDWTASVRETYVVCHDGSDGGAGGEGVGVEGEANCLLHFELAGGADEGQFPHVGAPIVEDPSDVGLHGKPHNSFWNKITLKTETAMIPFGFNSFVNGDLKRLERFSS